jgi:hypothetical protein
LRASRDQSGDPQLARRVVVRWDDGPTVHIELQYTGDHHDGLRIVSIFKQREAERLDTIHKQSAAFSALVLNEAAKNP